MHLDTACAFLVCILFGILVQRQPAGLAVCSVSTVQSGWSYIMKDPNSIAPAITALNLDVTWMRRNTCARQG